MARRSQITDDPQNGIKIVRTTKKGGTDVTEKYEAKDIKELEKKFPKGFKLYNQYLGKARPVAPQGVIQGRGDPARPRPGGIPIPGGGAVPPGGFVPMPPRRHRKWFPARANWW